MKKLVVLVALLLVVGGGYLAAAHLSGGAFPTPGLALGGEKGALRRTALKFLEDVQFKDFARAATYHDPSVQQQVDIPFLLQRLFQVRPEALDIMEYEVVFAELDSSGNRARVKTRVKVKNLADGGIKEQELMFYFERKDEKSPWYMKLEDSLRNLEAAPGKKS